MSDEKKDAVEKFSTVVPMEYRKDFMQSGNASSSKGSAEDPMQSQSYNDSAELEPEQIKLIYKNNGIAANVVDVFAEDATREGFKVIFADDSGGAWFEAMEEEKKRLKVDIRLREMVVYERLFGDGFISIGINEGRIPLSNEIEPENIDSVDFLNTFSRNLVEDGVVITDPFSPLYNQFESFTISDDEEGGDGDGFEVHPTRVLHFQTRKEEGEPWGIPIYVPLKDALTIMDSTAWSLGQVAYAMTFKVFKSAGVDVNSIEEWQQLSRVFASEFNTNTLGLIGKDDELYHEGPGGKMPNINELGEFVWEYLSACSRMPKNVIKGSANGTISSAQYDTLNYYARVSALQKNYLKPLIEKLVTYIINSNTNDIPADAEFEVKFNSLWQLSDEEFQKTKKREAEILQIYGPHIGAISAQEIRGMKFPHLEGEAPTNTDEDSEAPTNTDEDSDSSTEETEENVGASEDPPGGENQHDA